MRWCERAGYQDLEDIEPITVAAYIETLQRQAAPPTVKQHIAVIRMLFSWLTKKRSAGHESGPRSQDREIFADRRQNTFARIGAVVNLKVEDYYPSGKRFLLRFKEKGAKIGAPSPP
jgi:integrase/recombinase XerD